MDLCKDYMASTLRNRNHHARLLIIILQGCEHFAQIATTL